MRTFIAIEFPAHVKAEIGARQRKLQDDLRAKGAPTSLRWTSIHNSHLTIRFLGETTPAQASIVTTELSGISAAHGPFDLTIGQPDCFPSFRAPRVVWLDIGGTIAELNALQAQVEQAAQKAGFAAEPRAFSPHVTLARAQRNANRSDLRMVGQLLQEQAADMTEQTNHPCAPFTVREIVYMQSQLRAGGSLYTPLQRFPLAKQKR